MTNKEEIVDFLRNEQKALEIRTKANGINSWVLLGALAVVFWILVDHINFKSLANKELIMRAIIFGQNLYVFSFFLLNSDQYGNELRYAGRDHIEYPLYDIVAAAWLLLPSVLFFIYYGSTFGIYTVGFFGAVVAVFALKRFFKKLLGVKQKEKFPNPNFNPSRGFEDAYPMLMGVVFFSAVVYELTTIINKIPLDAAAIKLASLILAFYMLIIFLLVKYRETRGLEWTYNLEKDLLLGLVSPDVALRKIEHRSLGPKLEEVMNEFFDVLDKKLEELEESLVKCSETIEAIKSIPEEYTNERKLRSEAALQDSSDRIKFLLDEISEFFAYLERLQKGGAIDKRVSSAVENLLGRGKEYFQKVKIQSEKFKELESFQ